MICVYKWSRWLKELSTNVKKTSMSYIKQSKNLRESN